MVPERFLQFGIKSGLTVFIELALDLRPEEEVVVEEEEDEEEEGWGAPGGVLETKIILFSPSPLV